MFLNRLGRSRHASMAPNPIKIRNNQKYYDMFMNRLGKSRHASMARNPIRNM